MYYSLFNGERHFCRGMEKTTIMKYLLALDIGTTAVKGALFDRGGGILAESLREYDLLKPAPDWVELDCDAYWRAVIAVTGHVLKTSGVPPEAIASIGVTSQGETLIVLDRAGRPLRRAIVWLDNRTQAEADAIGRVFDRDDVYRVTGQQEIIPSWTATRILWLKKHEPDVVARAHKFMLAADYIVFKLTGRAATNRALNPSTLYYDIARRDWWPEMLSFLGISRDRMPDLVDSVDRAGAVTAEAAAATGLAAGTPVTAAPIDQVAAAVGAGNIEPGLVTENTGAALALCVCLDKPLYDPRKRLGLYEHAVAGRYVLLPWVPTAGMVLRWFRDDFGGGLDYPALCREAESVAPGADGLTMLPHLGGAGCPEVDPKARGVFSGITLGHRRGHFVRAIMESVAFILRGNLDLLAELGVGVRELRSLGGAARSDFWVQIKADVCRKTIRVMESEEATCRGTAMLSGAATGMFSGLPEARDAMVRVKKAFEPDPGRASAYDEAYRRYCALNSSMKTAW